MAAAVGALLRRRAREIDIRLKRAAGARATRKLLSRFRKRIEREALDYREDVWGAYVRVAVDGLECGRDVTDFQYCLHETARSINEKLAEVSAILPWVGNNASVDLDAIPARIEGHVPGASATWAEPKRKLLVSHSGTEFSVGINPDNPPSERALAAYSLLWRQQLGIGVWAELPHLKISRMSA